MFKRILAIIAVLGWAAGLSVPAYAAGAGSIKINLTVSDKPVSGVRILLSKAGNAVPGGYLLTEAFGGGMIAETDILLPELADWLAQEKVSGIDGKTDEEGTVFYPGLEEGLYLVKQVTTANMGPLFAPFVVVIPWDGNEWNLELRPVLETGNETPAYTADSCYQQWPMYTMFFSGVGILTLQYLKTGKKRRKYI